MGRPRSFDTDKALLTAINIFWEKGYDGTSIRDLTEAMGINSPSLYSFFGDKENLYIQAIKRYVSNKDCPPLDAFKAEENIEKAVKQFLLASIKNSTDSPNGRKGCFMTNCVSGTTESIKMSQELLQQAILVADKKIAERFDREKKRGTLPLDFPSEKRAKLLFDIRQGYILRARAGINPKELKSDLDYRVSIIVSV